MTFEHGPAVEGWLRQVVDGVRAWESSYPAFEAHPATVVDPGEVEQALGELLERLRGNYPFFHPSYAGQMLKPPHPVAVAGYLAAMLVNPNNHALDGGPPTSEMEKQVVAGLAAMFGLPDHLGHLTSSGTIANLEALFVARELNPDAAIAFGADAHYTHARMCHLLGVRGIEIPADADGQLDLDVLESLLRKENVGTVVLTAGTTGLGTVDRIDQALALRERYGVRLHVDAAYGGFFALVPADLDPEVAAAYRAIARCDSVVVDPHKQGLQPYGCGAVLFADPSVGRFYRHDSPYTYFTSDDLHLGEISLECSRAGAAAAALWLTLRLFPLTAGGLGRVLSANLAAARRWHELLCASAVLAPVGAPALDIVAYRVRAASSVSEVDATSAALFEAAMRADEPVFVSTLRLSADRLAALAPGLRLDAPAARVLRSVLLKPEHETYAEAAVALLEQHARTLVS